METLTVNGVKENNAAQGRWQWKKCLKTMSVFSSWQRRMENDAVYHERLGGVSMTRCYTNPRLPYLTLPCYTSRLVQPEVLVSTCMLNWSYGIKKLHAYETCQNKMTNEQ